MTMEGAGNIPTKRTARFLAVGTIAILATLASSWAQGSGLAVVEPGYQVTNFPACGFGWRGGIPTPNGICRGVFTAAACSPGGPWGEGLYIEMNEGCSAYNAYVERVDFNGQSTPACCLVTGLNTFPSGLAFSPPGWPGGDRLFVTILQAYFVDPITYVWAYSPPDVFTGTLSAPGAVGRLAVDPSGDFGQDIFFDAYTWPDGVNLGIFRQTADGTTTPFSMVGGVGRFGPGGVWGTGLYDSGSILHPDASLTSFPVDFGRNFDWVPGPGFDGDMFSLCGSDICRIRPDGTSSVFATGRSGGYLTSCGGALWIPGNNGCDVISLVRLAGTADISPSSLNVKGQGNDISFRVSVSDIQTGAPLDPSLLSPAWVSKVASRGIGIVELPAPSAEPTCDDATQDGIWETLSRRVTSSGDGSVTLRFSTPADGHCSTMDGDRQDIIALLGGVVDGDPATICVSARYPGYFGPVEICGTVTVQNQGNR